MRRSETHFVPAVAIVSSALPAPASLGKRRVGTEQAGRTVDDRAFERAALDRKVFGKKARQRKPRRGVLAHPLRAQRLLRQQTTAGRKTEQPQIRRRPGERCVGCLTKPCEKPLAAVRKAVDRFAKPGGRRSEGRIVAALDRCGNGAQLLDMCGNGRAAGKW